ncbi:glycosyl transferase [Tulasnella sp. JGI-2019a]|nr:glycosyl transferase [Tulasnella sp. JGI-2019a]KAG9017023.1 glycosyl transferase [Tulasnella sp. JGI-2019a]
MSSSLLSTGSAPPRVTISPATPHHRTGSSSLARLNTSDYVPREDRVVQADPFLQPHERDILVLSTIIKLLLYPAYRSTDFEVHRNWLAITRTLPISQWYYDTTSEWTLDYPPFFAYFEWFLSLFARLADPKITDLNNLGYDTWSVIAFQRTTVIVTELVMGAALLKFIRGTSTDRTTQTIISASIFLHPSFLIVDHIHFQYNGFMFGILLWSILMARNGNRLLSGFLFAVLLNFKHIYMYLAPAYFVYLLRSYCLTPQGGLRLPQFAALANAVIVVFVLSLGPFAIMGQLPQLLSRLFPFTRGLNHAYWAPNAWALITALDRVLLKISHRFGLDLVINAAGVSSTSRGLVGDTVFAVIPNVKPFYTFVITVASQLIFLAKLWTVPSYRSFVCALTLCGYSSFMFGWHVHEKAVMLVLVPLSLIAADNHAHFRTFTIASVAGIFSLFPLLFTPAESVVKILYSVIWGVVVLRSLGRRVYEYPSTKLMVLVDLAEKAYISGFVPLQAFVSLYPMLVNKTPTVSPEQEVVIDSGKTKADVVAGVVSQMEFLPLMLTSVYCAVGLVWAFLRLSYLYIRTY